MPRITELEALATGALSDNDTLIVVQDSSQTTMRMKVSVFRQANEDAITPHVNKAQAWASADEDTEVEGGLYSAKHHAAKAAASSTSAATAQTAAEAAQASAEDAEEAASGYSTASSAAKTASETAQAAAESAQAGAVAARGAAETAQNAAESAQSASEAAKTASETAQAAAEAAQAGAQGAQTASESAQAAAEAARDTAQGYRDEMAPGAAGGTAQLDTNGKVPLAQLPDTAKQQTYVVADSTARLSLADLIQGDKAFETSTGDSYVWNGSSWVLMADADWENVNLSWANITDKPTTFAPAAHSHDDIYYTETEVDALFSGYTAGGLAQVDWAQVLNKPDLSFEGHSHAISDITSLQDTLNAKLSLSGGALTGALTISGNTVWHAGNDGADSGLDADKLDGYHAGNSAGQVPLSNGTLNSTLNADLLDGYEASAFALSGHNHASTYLGISATAADSDKLDGYHYTSFASTLTVSSGTLTLKNPAGTTLATATVTAKYA